MRVKTLLVPQDLFMPSAWAAQLECVDAGKDVYRLTYTESFDELTKSEFRQLVINTLPPLRNQWESFGKLIRVTKNLADRTVTVVIEGKRRNLLVPMLTELAVQYADDAEDVFELASICAQSFPRLPERRSKKDEIEGQLSALASVNGPVSETIDAPVTVNGRFTKNGVPICPWCGGEDLVTNDGKGHKKGCPWYASQPAPAIPKKEGT